MRRNRGKSIKYKSEPVIKDFGEVNLGSPGTKHTERRQYYSVLCDLYANLCGLCGLNAKRELLILW